jgi:uncharacterized membrane protein YphA (DoxX/SURF4 family)
MNRSESLLARTDRSGWPLLLARLALGVMFVWMGTAKIVDPVGFLKLMRQYHALPESPAYYMNTVAVVLPWIETACGAALLLGLAVRGAGVVSVIMLAFFTPLIFVRGLELYAGGHGKFASFCAVNFDCGCGAGTVFVCHKTAENCGLLLAAIVAAVSRSRRFCLSKLFTRSSRPPRPRISVS